MREVIGRNRSRSRAGMSLFVRFALLCVGVLLVLAPGAFAVPPDPPYEFNTTLVNPTGSEVTVYDHSTQACQPDDIPDIGARAIKDSLGRTQLIVSHYNTRREIGTTLDNVTHNCNVVLLFRFRPGPW